MSTVFRGWQPTMLAKASCPSRGAGAPALRATTASTATGRAMARVVANAVHRSQSGGASGPSAPVPGREACGPPAAYREEAFPNVQARNATLAHELVQGPNVRFSKNSGEAPTAVLVHGILGSRRNMRSFAKLLVEKLPSWQVLLVDLRCHGESADHGEQGDHSVETSAKDVLHLLRDLKMFPQVLIGHSFGGKVVLSMANQFGRRLPKTVQIWVLDTLPGEVRAGMGQNGSTDHPAELIDTLRSVEVPFPRKHVQETLQEKGFSPPIVNWVATNMVGNHPEAGPEEMRWSFDLDGIAELYESYEETDLWPMLEDPPEGIRLDFVRAESSSFRWEGGTEDAIKAQGHDVHLLEKSGHWVHVDNPVALRDMIVKSVHDL